LEARKADLRRQLKAQLVDHETDLLRRRQAFCNQYGQVSLIPSRPYFLLLLFRRAKKKLVVCHVFCFSSIC
jgi:hypothetical protein